MSLNTTTKTLVARISRSEFPRTRWNIGFGVHNALMSAFNYARMYPAKMASFKEVLEYTLEKIYKWEEAQAGDLGEYVAPDLRVDTAVTNVVGKNNKPMPVIRLEETEPTFGPREQPLVPEVPRETARVAPAPAPMVSKKAWMPDTTVAKEEVEAMPSVPPVPAEPLTIQVATGIPPVGIPKV